MTIFGKSSKVHYIERELLPAMLLYERSVTYISSCPMKFKMRSLPPAGARAIFSTWSAVWTRFNVVVVSYHCFYGSMFLNKLPSEKF